ncbi:MAG: MarR family transcriptional regulator [Clostridia bacterium]|nr:MarR family transcriptional regulator [Clostridia bacterium]
MTDKEKTTINQFFVRVFNQILSWEEQSFKEMGISEITLRELHVIEAVYSLIEKGENQMSEIAKYLSITPGSLTTAVNCLVKKGYLERESQPNDRRVVRIIPTKAAEEVNKMHEKLHKEMIDGVMSNIDDKDMDVVLKTLEGLNNFFGKNQTSRR